MRETFVYSSDKNEDAVGCEYTVLVALFSLRDALLVVAGGVVH